jgi:hypothetical protein
MPNVRVNTFTIKPTAFPAIHHPSFPPIRRHVSWQVLPQKIFRFRVDALNFHGVHPPVTHCPVLDVNPFRIVKAKWQVTNGKGSNPNSRCNHLPQRRAIGQVQ